MNEILDFLVRHWQLSGLLVALLIAYTIFEFKQETGSKEVSPEGAVGLINHENGVIFDIRAKEAFASGHIVGAINVDSTEDDAKLKKLNKYAQKPVIVVCAHGKTSRNFVHRLEKEGFKQVLSLAGGMQAWLDTGLPTTQNNK